MGQTISKEVLQATLQIASSLTLAEAMNFLDSLDEIYLKRVIYCADARMLSFDSLGHNPYNLIKPCSLIGPIRFYGGPPTQRILVKGMASQYVADCILSAIIKFGDRFVSAKIDAILRHCAP